MGLGRIAVTKLAVSAISGSAPRTDAPKHPSQFLPTSLDGRGKRSAQRTLIWLDLSSVNFGILVWHDYSGGSGKRLARRWINLISAGWLPHDVSDAGLLLLYGASVN